jgi:microcompartment protein CcmL/EutN
MRIKVLLGLILASIICASSALCESSKVINKPANNLQSASQMKNQVAEQANAKADTATQEIEGAATTQSGNQEEMKGRLSQAATDASLDTESASDIGSKKTFGTNRQLNLRGSADLRGKSSR